MTDVSAADPAIGISLSIEIGRGRNLVFQSHIGRDCEVTMINDLLDKLNVASERQMAKCALDDLKHRYARQKMVLEQLTTDFYKIQEREHEEERKWNADSRRHGPWKRSEKDENHRGQMQSALTRANEETKELQRLLEEAEKAAA